MEIIIGAPTEENKHEMWHAMCHPRDVPIVVIVLRLGDHLGIVAGCQPVSYNTLHDLLCLWKHVHKFFSNKHYRDDMTFRAFIFRNVCSSIVLFFFFFCDSIFYGNLTTDECDWDLFTQYVFYYSGQVHENMSVLASRGLQLWFKKVNRTNCNISKELMV